MKEHAGGFVSFVREQGVVGMAVGLAIGTSAGAAVKVIVDQFIAPIIAILTRGIDLNDLKWVIYPADAVTGQAEVAIGYGMIISAVITLLATAFVIYQIVHIMKLDKLDKKKDA
jgi:large conductance mechanosensitive channel